MDLDLRLVQALVTLAEHRHFGRAADALHTTQPSLTRQIARLERQIGTRLIDRSVRGNDLTEAGQVFLPQAQALLRAAAETVSTTRAAGHQNRLTVGYTEGIFITAAVRTLRHRYPDAEITTLHLPCNRAETAVLDHEVDTAVARVSSRTAPGLKVVCLYEEPRVLVIPHDHPFAGQESVTVADIAAEPLLTLADADPEWSSAWLADPRPDGTRARIGATAPTLADKFELIASGQAVMLSSGPHAAGVRPDLTTVPVEGLLPGQVAVLSRLGDRRRLVEAFRTSASAPH